MLVTIACGGDVPCYHRFAWQCDALEMSPPWHWRLMPEVFYFILIVRPPIYGISFLEVPRSVDEQSTVLSQISCYNILDRIGTNKLEKWQILSVIIEIICSYLFIILFLLWFSSIENKSRNSQCYLIIVNYQYVTWLLDKSRHFHVPVPQCGI